MKEDMKDSYSPKEFYKVFATYVSNTISASEPLDCRKFSYELKNSFDLELTFFETTYNGKDDSLHYDKDSLQTIQCSGWGRDFTVKSRQLVNHFYEIINSFSKNEELIGLQDFSQGKIYREIAHNDFYKDFIKDFIESRNIQKGSYWNKPVESPKIVSKINFLDRTEKKIAEFALFEDNFYALPGREILFISFWIKGLGILNEALIIDKRNSNEALFLFNDWSKDSSTRGRFFELKRIYDKLGSEYYSNLENYLPRASLSKEAYREIKRARTGKRDSNESADLSISKLKESLFGYYEDKEEQVEGINKTKKNDIESKYFFKKDE